MRNGALVAAIVLAAAVLLLADDDEPTTGTSTRTTVADRVETVESLDPVQLFAPRGVDDVLVVTQPLGGTGGTVVTIDIGTGSFAERIVTGDDWPAELTAPTSDDAYPEAEAAARSPDGTRIAVFTRAGDDSVTGISIYVEGRPARQFHRLQSVGDLVSRRIVWSPESDAVYFLAAAEDGSADRVIGIPVGGSPQTVVTFRERGFYGLGTV